MPLICAVDVASAYYCFRICNGFDAGFCKLQGKEGQNAFSLARFTVRGFGKSQEVYL
jgi:hypothetical protein